MAIYSGEDFRVLVRLQLRCGVVSMDITKCRCLSTGDGDDRVEYLLIVGTAFGGLLYKVELPSGEYDAERELTHVARVHDEVAVCLVKFSDDGSTAAMGTMDGRLFLRRLDTQADEELATFGTAVLSGTGRSACHQYQLLCMQHEARGCNEEGQRVRLHSCIGHGQVADVVELQGPQREPQTKTERRSWREQGCYSSADARGLLGPRVCGVLTRDHVAAGDVRFRVGLPAALAATGTGGCLLLHDVKPAAGHGFVRAAGSRWRSSRLLCHDTSTNLALIEWPFLDAMNGRLSTHMNGR